MEAFGTFQRQLKLALSKMRAKYIDHCNQMSGRKQLYSYMYSLMVEGWGL